MVLIFCDVSKLKPLLIGSKLMEFGIRGSAVLSVAVYHVYMIVHDCKVVSTSPRLSGVCSVYLSMEGA